MPRNDSPFDFLFEKLGVGDRLAQPRVRLRLALGELRFQPVMELLHHGAATLLMKLQALFRPQTTLSRFGLVTIHLAQHLQYVATLIGKVPRYFHELSSSMGEAVRQQNLNPRSQLRNIARERVAHLNGRARVLGTLLQYIGDVLAGMLASGEVQCNLPALAGGHDATGEHAVRSSDGSRINRNTRMLVSSLCTTSPCAACRINSSRAGLSNSAASSTTSHCVAAGNGIPS